MTKKIDEGYCETEIDLSPELYTKIEHFAKKHDLGISEAVCELIGHALEELKAANEQEAPNEQ